MAQHEYGRNVPHRDPVEKSGKQHVLQLWTGGRDQKRLCHNSPRQERYFGAMAEAVMQALPPVSLSNVSFRSPIIFGVPTSAITHASAVSVVRFWFSDHPRCRRVRGISAILARFWF
jgi:hypothetical protein